MGIRKTEGIAIQRVTEICKNDGCCGWSFRKNRTQKCVGSFRGSQSSSGKFILAISVNDMKMGASHALPGNIRRKTEIRWLSDYNGRKKS
jgi:hypothetical protein